ncbi:hypothetical protein [Pseudanabaena sp. PCC 6802]|uniref:hypothetical protein n=1 Tax=Pseudanabaena sp. PCC 6802 TaxID=118173 RepID=UPI0012E994E3|nr:hypothetical protein [Pseudanabaena sp. PCC 6802]
MQTRLLLAAVSISYSAIACQPAQNIPKKVVEKAEAYLRSQMHLDRNIPVNTEAQTEQQINQNDLCQTTEPLEIGFQIVLVADGSRYTLHSDRSGNNVEICMAEDAQPDVFAKYTGAGYTVKYPQSWRVTDEGLEPNGTNRVQFMPTDRSLGYIEIDRLNQVNAELDTAKNIKNFKEEKFDAIPLETSSGSMQEYVQLVVEKSGEQREWKVKALMFKSDKFVYKIKLLSSEDESALEKDFEQFVREFRLVK